jgi:hypothetical protein
MLIMFKDNVRNFMMNNYTDGIEIQLIESNKWNIYKDQDVGAISLEVATANK